MAPVDLSRRAAVRDAVMAMARKRGPSQRMPTRRQLSEILRVSGSTLHPILKELERQQILVLKHGSGIFVSEEIRQKPIGVVFGGDIFSPGFSPFWGLLLQAVRQQAGRRELDPRAYLDISQDSRGLGGHSQLVEDLDARRRDGLLLFSPSYQDDETGQLRASGVPLVVLGGSGVGWRVTHHPVALFRFAARELAVRGCRSVAMLGTGVLSNRDLLETELRTAGAEAVRLADWSYEAWRPQLASEPSRERFGYELVRRMIAARAEAPLPDSLLSADDTVTRGAIAALVEAGLHPGREIQIATGANKGSPVLDPYADDLVRIEYDPAEIVRAALDMLETLMDGGTPPVNPVLIEPRVVARASSP